jgi:hypothetical protein
MGNVCAVRMGLALIGTFEPLTKSCFENKPLPHEPTEIPEHVVRGYRIPTWISQGCVTSSIQVFICRHCGCLYAED